MAEDADQDIPNANRRNKARSCSLGHDQYGLHRLSWTFIHSAGILEARGGGPSLTCREPSVPYDRTPTSNGALSEQSRAYVSQLDQQSLEQVLNCMPMIGYPVPDHHAHGEPLIPTFHEEVSPIERMMALVNACNVELDKLMLYVNKPDRTPAADIDVRKWKEDMISRLLKDVMPGIGQLSHRIARKTAESMERHRVGRRPGEST